MFSADVAYPAIFQAVKLGDCKRGTYFPVGPAKDAKVCLVYGTKVKMEKPKYEELCL